MSASREDRQLGRGLSLALLSALLMAAWYPAMKLFMGRVSPLQAASVEALTTSVAALVWIALSTSTRARGPSEPRFWGVATLNVGALALLYLSLHELTPVTVSLVGRSYVLVCAVLAVAFLRERLKPAEWLLIIASSCATIAFVRGEPNQVTLLGLLSALGYVLCFAVANLLVKGARAMPSPKITLLWSRGLAALALPVLGVILEGRQFLSADVEALSGVALASLATMFTGLALYYRAIALVPFALVNAVRSMGPVFVALLALPLGSDSLSLSQIGAGLVCIASIVSLSYLQLSQVRRLSNSEAAENRENVHEVDQGQPLKRASA